MISSQTRPHPPLPLLQLSQIFASLLLPTSTSTDCSRICQKNSRTTRPRSLASSFSRDSPANSSPSHNVFLADIFAAPSEIPLCLSYFFQSKVQDRLQHPTRTCHLRPCPCILDNLLRPLFYTPTPSIFSLLHLDSTQEPCSTRWPSEVPVRVPAPDRAGNPTTPS